MPDNAITFKVRYNPRRAKHRDEIRRFSEYLRGKGIKYLHVPYGMMWRWLNPTRWKYTVKIPVEQANDVRSYLHSNRMEFETNRVKPLN